MALFASREDAGTILAQQIRAQFRIDSVVGIARGGVVVAYQIATQLHLPLCVLPVQKIGYPKNKELGIGAVAPSNVVWLDKDLIQRLHLSENTVQSATQDALLKFNEKAAPLVQYLPMQLHNRVVMIVDDGIATGATFRVALMWVKKQRPKCIYAAFPVATQSAALEIKQLVDEIIVLATPTNFDAVGRFYDDFRQVTIEDITRLILFTRKTVKSAL